MRIGELIINDCQTLDEINTVRQMVYEAFAADEIDFQTYACGMSKINSIEKTVRSVSTDTV